MRDLGKLPNLQSDLTLMPNTKTEQSNFDENSQNERHRFKKTRNLSSNKKSNKKGDRLDLICKNLSLNERRKSTSWESNSGN